MKKAAFARYLEEYIRRITKHPHIYFSELAPEAQSDNYQLREPLVLYALFVDKTHLILRYTTDEVLRKKYEKIYAKYNKDSMIRALEEKSKGLPTEYHKVWASYQCYLYKEENDRKAKELIRQKILELRPISHMSVCRICTKLKLNYGNVNDWVKSGNPHKLSLENARNVLTMMQKAIEDDDDDD